MKRNLGSLILIVFVLSAELFSYEWTAYASKKEAYINDSVHLKYECDFKDDGALYTIDFYPKADAKLFDLRLLHRNEKILDGKKRVVFEYVAKLKQAGEVSFDFKVHMKKTTLDSIVYTSGSRDDDKGDSNFILDEVDLETLKVSVLEHSTSIIGEFTLEVKEDKKEIQAYEPYHLDVKISGLGNFDDIKAIKYTIDGVKVFSQKPLTQLTLTKDGYKGEWSQKFAFVAQKDFLIPDVEIAYFDKKTSSIKRLHIQKTQVKVQEIYKKEELLDEVSESLKFNFEYLYYILTFLAGCLVSKIKFKRSKMNSEDTLFVNKVNKIKSINELSILLILHNQKLFQDIIREMDSSEPISLVKAKKKAINLKIKKRL
ncbi:MAG: hypothetical protein Q9M32_05210 [Sulfurimonas sp.]|nr:hypothetical protein [Sulfurimonas sp.]MDQ7062455.1 hypothetical protein [Sulfurimonas sp.]